MAFSLLGSERIQLHLQIADSSKVFFILSHTANQIGDKTVFPGCTERFQLLGCFIKSLFAWFNIDIAIEELDKHVNGFLHILSRNTTERPALIRIILAINTEEAAECRSEGQICKINMILYLQPVGKLVKLPFLYKLILFIAEKHFIDLLCATGKMIRLSVKLKGKVHYMVPHVLYTVTGRIGFPAKGKINSE